jgi:DNA-binding CsgD family transcriptional regulator/PAS domain-containing protein
MNETKLLLIQYLQIQLCHVIFLVPRVEANSIIGGYILQSIAELEQFSAVVEKIYDAALDQNLWRTALHSIAELVGADGAGIHFADMEKISQGPTHFHTVGFADSFNRKVFEFAQVWAVQSGLPFWQVGDVHHLPDIMPHEELINGKFYKEVISQEDQDDYIGMIAVKEGSLLAPMTLATEKATGPFKPRGLELVRLLSPHICRSSKISFALELKNLQNTMMETTLNTIGAGIYLVQRDGRIVFMNESAEKQITRGIGLSVLNNRITPKDQVAAEQFSNAMADCEINISTQAISIALPDENGGMLATIMPLNRGLRQSLTSGANPAVFAIFVQNPMAPSPNPGEGFARLYGLTQAETRTLMALSMSQGPQDAAEILGVSITTIRTHLQHIFTKTNTSGQSDLMQLMMRASAPISA